MTDEQFQARERALKEYLRWDPEWKDRPIHIWTAGFSAGYEAMFQLMCKWDTEVNP